MTESKATYNYKRDNKSSRPADIYTPRGYDGCQSPPYAVNPLLAWLPCGLHIWEPAAGEGYMGRALSDRGFKVITSDILTGQNFFDYQPEKWDAIITNPPFSLKYKWMARCYQLGKPFALLLPVETMGAKTAQAMFAEFGVEVVFLSRRVNFKMPKKGWDSSAQFPVCWITWRLGIGRQMTFAKLEAA